MGIFVELQVKDCFEGSQYCITALIFEYFGTRLWNLLVDSD